MKMKSLLYTILDSSLHRSEDKSKMRETEKGWKSLLRRKQRCDDAILSGNIYFNIKNFNFQTYIYSNAIAFYVCALNYKIFFFIA